MRAKSKGQSAKGKEPRAKSQARKGFRAEEIRLALSAWLFALCPLPFRLAPMTLLHVALMFITAFFAGVVNSIAGGGMLLAFPLLIWLPTVVRQQQTASPTLRL